MVVRLSLALILILNCFLLSKAVKEEDLKLELLQVIFRHGDRVPETGELYKGDPNPRSYYEALGFGKLTSKGRLTEHKIGQMLRKKYNTFLGDYHSDEVYAFSSGYNRTQESLKYLLTGLYNTASLTATVQNIDKIEKSTIPYEFKENERNFLFALRFQCPTLKKLYTQASEFPIIKAEFKKYQEFVNYVEQKTSFKILTPGNAYRIFLNLRSNLSMNKPLPSWCPPDCYKKLQYLTKFFYKMFFLDKDLAKYLIGPTMEVFLRNILNEKSKRKIYLYSAHDINIGTIISGLHITNIPEIPDYGSSIIVEKWRDVKNKMVYIRMLNWTGVSEKLLPMRIPGCDDLCPLEKYENIMQAYIPSPSVKQCLKLENEY